MSLSKSELTSYEYRVSLVGDYWDMNLRVTIELDEFTGNCSEQAQELAQKETWLNYPDLYNKAQEMTVTLLLDGEEIEL